MKTILWIRFFSKWLFSLKRLPPEEENERLGRLWTLIWTLLNIANMFWMLAEHKMLAAGFIFLGFLIQSWLIYKQFKVFLYRAKVFMAISMLEDHFGISNDLQKICGICGSIGKTSSSFSK
jgi:hypothetical protein